MNAVASMNRQRGVRTFELPSLSFEVFVLSYFMIRGNHYSNVRPTKNKHDFNIAKKAYVKIRVFNQTHFIKIIETVFT